MTGPGRVKGGPQVPARGGERADVPAEPEPGDHLVPGSQPEQRAVPPVCQPYDAAGLGQAVGAPPSGTVAVTAPSRGSTRETVASSGSSTHSPAGPVPATAGASPTRVVLVRVPVRASIRARVPDRSVATHTAPSAAARPPGPRRSW